MPFYEKGDVRIRYEEAGSGFPLLVTPGGGLNSRVSNWPTAVFNAHGGLQERLPLHHDGPAQRQWRRVDRPDPDRRPVGRLCRRPARADGPSRHPRVLLYGLLHRRLLCRQAAAASARPRRRRRVLPDRRAPAGRSRTSCTTPARTSGRPNCCPAARPEHGARSSSTCTTSTGCSPTSCTACRATSSGTARRRCWCCRTTRRRTRCRPRSMSPRWRRTPRSRCSRGASRRS